MSGTREDSIAPPALPASIGFSTIVYSVDIVPWATGDNEPPSSRATHDDDDDDAPATSFAATWTLNT
jgi:hypothetical protein